MASETLKEAIAELSKYFALSTLEDLVGTAITSDENQLRQLAETRKVHGSINDSDGISKMAQLLVDAQTGARLSKDIVAEYDRLFESDAPSAIFSTVDGRVDNIIIVHDGNSSTDTKIADVLNNPDGINKNANSPTKEEPSLAAFSINSVRITPSTRNSSAVALFMNTVPTIEFSKCVPFLDVQFQLFRDAFDTSGRPQTISLTKFLNGAAKIEEGSADYAMHGGVPVGQNDNADAVFSDILGDGQSTNGFSGMEIFTAPQTLVDADTDNGDSVRVAPVIDKFRPFLSIVNFSVSVVATTGVMSYKTAKLDLVLHDRSRLYEIADFVKPDMAGEQNSELLIEYGWSHPETDSKVNPYGPFLNAMRKKEKYHIRNSSFVIKDNGEVAVSLELYMKGSLDFYTSTISDGGEVEEAQKVVAQIQKRIGDLRSRVFKQTATFMKEIRGIQILNAASDETSQLELTREMKKELKSSLKQLKNTPGEDAQALVTELGKLFGSDGTDGAVRTLNTKLSKELQNRMDLVIERGGKKTIDPYIFPGEEATENESKNLESNYVSFGKLALIFLGQPLAASKKFDDIQFLFYPMNSGAGKARELNMAQFPIEISRFREKFNKVKTLRRSNNLTLRDFCQFMGTTFFDDPSALAYGMRDLYTYENDKELGTNVRPKKKFKGNPAALNHEVQRRMEEAGVPNGLFKMPHLDIYIETVPAESTEGRDNSKAVNDSRTILRVHFYDRNASSYESLGELLRAARDNDIGSIKPPPDTKIESGKNDHAAAAREIIEQARNLGLIENISEDGTTNAVQIKGGPKKLKEFIANTMPSIIYGGSATAVGSAGFKTMNDPRLSTVNMLRSGDASPLTPTGAGQGGIPLWMHPGQMDMNIIGCPLIEFTQGFFVDFQTNTSIDNIYAVTKLDHTINGGEFKTSLSLVPFDAYGQYRALRDRVSGALAIAKKLVADTSSGD
jgi:hypothetical protein